jgi:ketosteroid isomerase-like protein
MSEQPGNKDIEALSITRRAALAAAAFAPLSIGPAASDSRNLDSQPVRVLDMSATKTLERMLQAINSHDIDAMVDCFADDYRCEIPLHPSRSFVGNDQVRQNWTGLFRRVPNIEARVLRSVEDGDALWSEWEMTGITTDGVNFCTVGVAILGVEDDRFAWARFYLDPVDDQPTDASGRTPGVKSKD